MNDDTIQIEKLILRSVQEAVIATDISGRIIYWNLGAEKLYQWKAEEVIGAVVTDIIQSDLSAEEGAKIMGALFKGETWTGDFLVRRKDGEEFRALVNDRPMYDDDGNFFGIVGTSVDMKSEDLRRQLSVSHLAHELRAPVSGIIGIIRSLLENGVERDDDDLEDLFQSSCNLLSFINSLVALPTTSLHSNLMPVEVCDPSAIIRQVVKTIMPLGKNDNIKFLYQPDNVPSAAIISSLCLQQTLFNLLSNAYKYTRPFSQVTCVAFVIEDSSQLPVPTHNRAEHAQYLVIRVRDQGKGMTAEEQLMIFSMGVKLENKVIQGNSVQSTVGSNGFGLYNCKASLAKAGGAVWISWSEVGKGTEFSAAIPFQWSTSPPTVVSPTKRRYITSSRSTVTTDSSDTEDSSSVKPGVGGQGEVEDISVGLKSLTESVGVLVCDDDPICRKMLTRLLRNEKILCEQCVDGRQALQIVLERAASPSPIRVLFLDLSMPVMDGYECAAAIREALGDSNMPVICALSSSNPDEVYDRCRHCGITLVEAKPLTPRRIPILFAECFLLSSALHN